MRTIAILGGGIGGIVAANELRRRIAREHRIVLIERNADHAFAPSFLWLMTGAREPAQLRRPLAALLRPGIELVQAEARRLDLSRRKIETGGGEFSYDYLVVALGAALVPEAVPGLPASAHTFYTFEGAARLRDAIRDFSRGSIAVVVAATPYKCPAAPHEGALLLADHFHRRGLSGSVEVHLLTPEPQPMPVAGPQLGEAVRNLLAARGVSFHPLHALSSINAEKQELLFQAGQPFRYDLLAIVPPHQGQRVLIEAGLTNSAGWVPVNPRTLATGREDVYAIGDATAIPIPGRWKPDTPLMLPKAGVFAHLQAAVVADRIAAALEGRSPAAEFCGDGSCMLEAGGDLAGFAFGNFFAQPSPAIELRQVGRAWHLGKVLYEKWWLAPLGLKRDLIGWALKAGGKFYGIPVTL
jgi:sulfide:quinone oxidoreductase